ncbi:MAG TPA: biopolymer transporter ExbD [Candidatus Baltobacteraceae bacterium]|jgi:biopolymer transport protein ExbD|nr:biopolymer transporter ExbD [Candidatus Baltobacteraceae bacterium]
MKKTSRRGHSTMNELNITPLLDLVFVLLVIFIITTPQMINSLEMSLPSSQKPPPPDPNKPKPKINRVIVDEKGAVFLNNEFVPDASLLVKFKGLLADDPDPKVVVKGSDDVEYQGMIKVLDVLQQLNITKVGLATQ